MELQHDEASMVLERLKDSYQMRERSLVCMTGTYGDCPFLKLQKAHWSNLGSISNQKSGIFFSIWFDKNCVANDRANYNIHALKLRELAGYKLASREFAEAFRMSFEPNLTIWPNVSVSFGPQTLMQGWISVQPQTIESDLLNLMESFTRLESLIDGLLQERVDLRTSK